jgi:hypothetical protein
MRNPRPASQEATPQHDVAAKHVGQDEAGITEQRARAQTTFCLTRYPATAASRLISSSPLSCPWSREGNPHVRGATLVPPAAASKWLKRKRRAQSIDRERDDSWMSAVEGPTLVSPTGECR